MNFLIITNVAHTKVEKQFFAYAPYIHEMNIWIKNASKITIFAPIVLAKPTEIDFAYQHQNINFFAVQAFDFLCLKNSLKSLILMPFLCFKLFIAMSKADHIHLRCPGNMGLLACFVQILFPKKPKSAKYAGNWDFTATKPFTYKLQQYILNNSFLTRNMQVLVYGEWKNSSKNIVPFFTATYSEKEKTEIIKTDIKDEVKFIFTGMLVKGKNPLYAIQLIENLNKVGIKSTIELYGEGVERELLQNYIQASNLQKCVFLKGNQSKEKLQIAYQKSHFVLLPSISEGWPKTIAEGMFWGCVPMALPISCVPQMLDFGNRGLLLTFDLENDLKMVCDLILDINKYNKLSVNSKKWSQKFTTEKFEIAIKNILQS